MVQDTILGKSFGNFFVELKRRILVMSLIVIRYESFLMIYIDRYLPVGRQE